MSDSQDERTKLIKPEKQLPEPSQRLAPWVNNHYIHAATSDNTRKAYCSDIRHYEKWSGRLPATPEMVTRYLEAFAEKLNPRTLSRRLVAIKHWHIYQGFSDPTTHPAVNKTLTGILRVHGKPKQKARPLSPQELRQIVAFLLTENTTVALRDNALLQIGYFGALRRSELVQIQFEHLKWEKEGLEILLPSSKTDQQHIGQFCAIPYGQGILCPIRALKSWLAVAEVDTGFIFRRITVHGTLGANALTPLSVNHILKARALAANIEDAVTFSSHSLRRGLATSAARAGAPLEDIMRAGRWKQVNTVMEYIEANKRLTQNAAASVLRILEDEKDR